MWFCLRSTRACRTRWTAHTRYSTWRFSRCASWCRAFRIAFSLPLRYLHLAGSLTACAAWPCDFPVTLTYLRVPMLTSLLDTATHPVAIFASHLAHFPLASLAGCVGPTCASVTRHSKTHDRLARFILARFVARSNPDPSLPLTSPRLTSAPTRGPET